LVGLAISDAVRALDLPEGVFSLLFGRGEEIGMQLVRHPEIKAGGFTGSRSGGLALTNAAAARPEPIPFYAEMSSVNPVFILPGALEETEKQIAAGLHSSVTLGAGQFCTNPGLVFIPEGASSAGFVERLKAMMASTAEFTMLTNRISTAYREGTSALSNNASIETLVQHDNASSSCNASAGLFQTDASSFLADPSLSLEVFGPATLLVTYADPAQLLEIAQTLEGQLTVTIHATAAELESANQLKQVLEYKAGRVVFNSFPTGVEVCHAMVHGGPFPATSDGRSTSVGTRAVFRFVRPVCYQDAPDAVLPDELRDANSSGIWRLVDGELTKASLSIKPLGSVD
jgi:NADP-dependent aldehyde dehydrogenase